jgi:ferredoxin
MFPEMFDWDEAADRPIPKPGPFEPEKVREAQALCPRQCIEAEPD